MNRREFTIASGAAALMGALAPASFASANTPLRWAPYANTLAIDLQAGVGNNGEEALNAQELAEIRATGLSAINVTIAPQGAFWFGPEAAERREQQFRLWEDRFARHPETFMAIRTRRRYRPGACGETRRGDFRIPGHLADRRGLEPHRCVLPARRPRHSAHSQSTQPGRRRRDGAGQRGLEQLRSSDDRGAGSPARHGRSVSRRPPHDLEAIKATKRPPILGHTGCARVDRPTAQPDGRCAPGARRSRRRRGHDLLAVPAQSEAADGAST